VLPQLIMMKTHAILLLSLLFTASCVEHEGDDDHDRDHDDDKDERSSCSTDADCGRGDLCGPPGVCLATDDVRSVEVAWTIGGKPASDATCGRGREGLLLTFKSEPEPGRGEVLRFTYVPCASGRFVMDRLPWEFWVVTLETSVTGNRAGVGLPIAERGPTVIDLPY
jgi:hypothetical protein